MVRPEDSGAWTIAALLQWATAYFDRHGIDSPRATGEILLAHALNLRRIDLYLRHDQPLNRAELAVFKALVKRRRNREPVAYITGQKEFYSLTLAVGPAVLIPRPETETLVEKALALIDQGPGRGQRIIDLGTGSGAIVIALAHQRPAHCYFAVDASLPALAFARSNAATHQVDASVRFFCGNWLDAVFPQAASFDLVLSNPPYIPTAVIDGLAPEVSRHEPRLALDGGPDGMVGIGKVLTAAPQYLIAGGWVVVEIGFDQGPAVCALAVATGRYDSVVLVKDLAGHDRVLVARRNHSPWCETLAGQQTGCHR